MSRSIWDGVDKAKFYADLKVATTKYNKAPALESSHSHSEWKARGNHDGKNRLLFVDERSWVSDMAFLAADGDTAGAVTSFFVEELIQERQLKFYGAANEGLKESSSGITQSILSSLGECARKEVSRVRCVEDILAFVVPVHFQRIHCRLESSQCVFPDHKRKQKPDPFIPKLVERIKNISISTWGVNSASELAHLQDTSYELGKSFNVLSCGDPASDAGQNSLLVAILKQAYAMTTCLGRKTLETALGEKNVHPKDSFLKHVRQLDKLARYWGACKKLAYLARANNSLFDNFTLELVPPIPPSPISGDDRYVHAEIQLLIFVSVHPLRSRPRAFGVNKAGCYLCDCFIAKHGRYFTWGSHGTLLHMWKFPDANEIRERYGNIDEDAINGFNAVLRSMRADLTGLLSPTRKGCTSRQWAMQSRVFDSWETLPTFSASSLTSSRSIANLHPEAKRQKIRSPTPQRRQDSGYESGLEDERPSAHPSRTNLTALGNNNEEDCTTASPAGETTFSREPPELGPRSGEPPRPRSFSTTASSPKASSLSLITASSAIDLMNTTATSASKVLSSNRTTTFISKHLNLYLKLEPQTTSTHETTVRVRPLPDHQSILALLSEGSPNPVLDRRGLMPGETCTIPVPETDSGRKLKLILGKDHEGDGVAYLELENRCTGVETS